MMNSSQTILDSSRRHCLHFVGECSLAAILFSFCWLGHERVHKMCRLIPACLCLGLSAVWMQLAQSSVALTYNYSALISMLMFLMLIVSILPQAASTKV